MTALSMMFLPAALEHRPVKMLLDAPARRPNHETGASERTAKEFFRECVSE